MADNDGKKRNPTLVELKVTSVTVTSTRKMPVYNAESRAPVSYSSDETGQAVTFECAVPLQVEIGPDFEPGTPEYFGVLCGKLQSIVDGVTSILADVKMRDGMAIPHPQRVEFKNGQAKVSDGF